MTDGGFEDVASFANDWTISGQGVGLTMDAHSGTWAASFAAVSYGGTIDQDISNNEFGYFGSIAQNLATTPGTSYTFDFFLSNVAGGSDSSYSSEFQAIFGGTTVLDLMNQPYFSYTEYQFTVTATSSTTALTFNGFNNIAEYYLDDVSVTPVAAVPEPSTAIPVVVAAAIGLGSARGRRRARRSA